ncbi:Transposase and inactivated derivatives, IS30 family [Nakamurella panacisegetis]|uniref:Transposase and inactivated derivatives, IS30 family n=2 Tax=Nakamurella panacisegetis TaxID=1090615 RepID=A0A1H0NAC1_9ACTN|nr:IS30 family transposase [Nakamurella panacisegetis]SDO89611.1 Transposase and inactivated derivatives, IS30 family [Nakamurella panacisegetis]SDP33848.1 Transposase and inactivated derivatives, IS30 family [Nakamurella panacisegetis]
MPRFAANKMPAAVKRRYFELIRTGLSGAAASEMVGVSLSCGSLWFIDAGSVSYVDTPISNRYLNQDDRIEIADGLARGEPVKSIAARIGRSFQTVYREIARNSKADGRYQPWFAHNQAHERRRRPKPHRFAADDQLRAVVAGKLKTRWSPGQISRWLRRRYRNRPDWHVCAETIYAGVYRGLICAATPSNLRTARIYRHRRGRGRTREGAMKQLTKMKSISSRPAVVERRGQVGHWEGDLIIGAGQRSAIATLVERKTRHTVLVPLPDGHSAQSVGDALIAVFAGMPPALRRTLTWDQGNEMFHHDRIERATKIKIYFADPHSPWQRGSNENTNGLLRQYFPKGTDLSLITAAHLAQVTAEMNSRPRLCLADRTPAQLMRRWDRRLATQ